MNGVSNLSDLIATGKKVFVVAENIRSAYNVGAMFRTADGTGITGMILVGYTPTPENPKVAKTGLGAEFSVPWYAAQSLSVIFEFAEDNGIPEYGLELTKFSENIFDAKLEFPLFLYVGNEVEGLSSELMVHLEKYLELPMNGVKGSLNVAEATSIAMYELFRQSRLK